MFQVGFVDIFEDTCQHFYTDARIDDHVGALGFFDGDEFVYFLNFGVLMFRPTPQQIKKIPNTTLILLIRHITQYLKSQLILQIMIKCIRFKWAWTTS